MGGGKDVSQIAPYMGTNQDDDDKGSLWAWEFLFARCFFFLLLCLVQYRSSLGSSVHIEVARGRSFGRSVRLGRPVRSVGLSLVVNNKMFCFNHIVASSYAYALAEGEGDRRSWDSFSFTFAFTLLVPLPLLQLRFLLLFFHHFSCCCCGCFLHLAASARSSFLWAALVIVVVVVVVIVL